jgi:1-acyl-sn-glycerol-3-phosphate acyltransferase
MAEPVYRPIVLTGKALFALMRWRVLVTGADLLPRSGPAVIACNHVSYLDPLLIGFAAEQRGRVPRFLAKRELFEVPVWGLMLRQMRHVPVDRAKGAGASVASAVAALSAGEIVTVFPEGTISQALVPKQGKTGAARMAMAAGVPLLPAALWGAQRIATKGRPREFRRGVTFAVRFGAPVGYDAGEDPGVVTERLMDTLTELVDQAARTYPQRPSGPDDRWWIPHHLGGTAPTIEEAAEIMRREADERHARRRGA